MLTKVRKILLCLIMLYTIFIEVKAFGLTINSLGTGIFVYYTEISNLITLLSSAVALVYIILKFGAPNLEFPRWLSAIRFLSATMLLMTMLITIFVLVPYSPHLKDSLLFSGYGLYHHTIAPIVTILSFVFFEPHSNKKRVVFIPLLATAVYGAVMILLNIMGKVIGPYFFLRVNYQPVPTSIMWCAGLLLLVLAFACLVYFLAFIVDFIKRKITKN
jgi:hypothetical protein